MNTEKMHMSNNGLLAEADRSLYEDKTKTGEDGKKVYKDTVSKSIIDFGKTHLNYNLCPHEQYKPWEIKAIHEKIRGKRMPKNAVAWGSTIITMPKDYTGDKRAFFECAYKNLKKMYGLKDEDVVSAYVHMDESTPHMHFYFLPIKHEEEKDRVSWETVMPRWMYKTQHEKLQKVMSEDLGEEVHLLNGETLGIDVSKMDADQRKKSMELAETDKAIENRHDELETLDIFIDEKQATIEQKQATIASLDAQIAEKKKMWENIAETILKPCYAAQERLIFLFKELKPKEQAKEQETVFDILNESNDALNRGNPAEIRQKTEAVNEKSDEIEATYLSIDEDDNFER